MFGGEPKEIWNYAIDDNGKEKAILVHCKILSLSSIDQDED